MITEICVWTGGDRNHLSLWDRLNGHTAAVKEEGWPWTVNETGGNHRVVKVRGATVKELIFLRQHAYRMVETRPNHFEHDSMGRCGVLLPEHLTNILVNLPPGEILEIDKAFLMKGIRVAPEWPTLYMSDEDKVRWYATRRHRRMVRWNSSTFLRAA